MVKAKQDPGGNFGSEIVSSMLSPEELLRRKPVWTAISEFYLDTELDETDLRRIAKVLLDSQYSLNELREINYNEVAPIVSPNLLSTAGPWSGFNEKWLHEEILNIVNKKKQKSIFTSIYRKYIDWSTNRYWKTISKEFIEH